MVLEGGVTIPLCLSTPVPVRWHLEVSEGVSLLSELLLGLPSGSQNIEQEPGHQIRTILEIWKSLVGNGRRARAGTNPSYKFSS